MIVKNFFHKTVTEIRPKDGRISKKAYIAMMKRLCPHKDCFCSSALSALFIPVDRQGKITSDPEFYEVH